MSWVFVFRTDDFAKWGAGKGSNLTAVEFDNNNWDLLSRIVALETNPPQPKEIVSFEVIDQQFYVHLSDGSTAGSVTLGPYDLPVLEWQFLPQGWQPDVDLFKNEVFAFNGVIYRVLRNHHTGLVFDPGANSGTGEDFYAELLETAPGVPAGGDTGMVLTKTSDNDYDAHWQEPTEIGAAPPGGLATPIRQFLGKVTNADFETGWFTVLQVPAGGNAGQVLRKQSGSAYGWEDDTLEALADVAIATGVADGDILEWAGTGAQWVNGGAALKVINNLGDLDDVSLARENLDLAIATASDYQANVADKVLTTDEVWTAMAPATLTDAATIVVDMSTFIDAEVTLGGNRTLGNPILPKVGQRGRIKIKQDGTGSRTLAYSSNWKFANGTAPVLSTAANAVDVLYYDVVASNFIYGSLIKNVS
jgi:hypothetical protein